ncbi:MAG: hypothetical protein RIC16_00410 [Rhodospirillales bacterium]
MPAEWKRFLLIRLPIWVLGIVAAVELLAALLAGAPLDRHPLDRLVNGLPDLAGNAEIALTGDSVTRELAKYYDVDTDGRVLNLTTNKASAVVGVLLLWRRLSETAGTPPRHLVMAVTPEFLTYVPDPATYQTYVWSVFSRDDERATLRKLGYPDFPASRFPAVRSLQSTIYDPLMGRLFATGEPPTFGPTVPQTGIPTEGPGGEEVSASLLRARFDFDGSLSDVAARSLSALCSQLDGDGATLTIGWAPTPESVRRTWEEHGVLERLRERITRLEGCANTAFLDINGLAAFPDHAFRDLHHLRWPGWINAYGLVLKDLLAGLR